jgi:flagellar basal-body rod modification protein FlgD
MSTVTSATDVFASLNRGTTTETANEAGSADRFLKLLVAQMRNQDPLNPMDNAQVTSQMAQINTVDGINRLNDTVSGLNSQFVQLQALQGASLLGRDVSVSGDRLSIAGEGDEAVGRGGFELAGTAERVRLEVLDGAGNVVGSRDLGAHAAGAHRFEWPVTGVTDTEGLRFRITATNGSTTVTTRPLNDDRVLSVSTSGSGLQLGLANGGTVDYGAVRAVRMPG